MNLKRSILNDQISLYYKNLKISLLAADSIVVNYDSTFVGCFILWVIKINFFKSFVTILRNEKELDPSLQEFEQSELLFYVLVENYFVNYYAYC
jgi:hypothetical protein